MEVDLELPSSQEDKLQDEMTINTLDGFLAAEGDVHSSKTSAHVQNSPEPISGEDIVKLGDEVGGDVPEIDVVNKAVDIYEPQNGLEFDTKEAAYSFYREYARVVGFGITIKASRRSKKSGKFIDVKIACSRFGNKRESSGAAVSSRSCPKTDCKASMHMKRKEDGKWFIHSFIKEHNHEICPDDFNHAIRGRNKQSGIVSQKKGLQLSLNDGDVQMLLEFFMLMQDENPSFFYAIDLDSENRLRNIFWVDAKGRQDYSYFSDVVFLDTSYIRNKYRIPFAPIIGVNHHFQFMLLGCALIGDETTSSFVWAMRTWLKAVGGQAPRVIITDEDKSLLEATKEVFPDTRHCFCLWHVFAKLSENLGDMTDWFEEFMLKFNKCIYQSWTDEQFEKRWRKMVDKFELGEDEWMSSLYEERGKWVPTYMRGTFLAGMSTTERCGSLSSVCDKYIHRETTLNEFVHQYKVYMCDRYEEEAKADVETLQRQPTLRSLSPFEKQMSKLYTPVIFKKFQDEVLGIAACRLEKECENEFSVTFRVDDFDKQQKFVVVWNEKQQDISCLCRSFEYSGFLCRHAMIVLQMSGATSIPSHYVLKRWTVDALKIEDTNSEISSSSLRYRLERFNDLCRRAIKLGEEGSLSQETYEIAFNALEEALKRSAIANRFVHSCVAEPNPSMMSNQGFLNIEEEDRGSSKMAKASKKKRVHKKRKVQSDEQEEIISIQDSGQQQQQQQMEDHLRPRSHASLDNNYYIPQPGDEMELGSRGSSLDGYYDTQQGVQGMEGVTNSLSSTRDGYYNPQQGLGQLYPIQAHVGHYAAATQQSLQGFDWIQP